MAREPLSGLLGACALAATATVASAAPEEFVIDGAHTFPTFAVVHLGISTQRGRFERTTGRIVVDREAQSGSLDIVIDTTSISTGSPRLDPVLKGDDFFDVEKHPRMVFHAKRLEFESGVPRRAVGTLTLLGNTRPVTLEIERFACTRLPFFVRTTCGADASTTISRTAFGMSRWTTFISDEVKIAIQIEAVKVEVPIEPPAGG